MKGPNNMEIKYEDGKLKLEWVYKITRFSHETKLSGTVTQFIINLNTTILKFANIRKVLFLYKGKDGVFHFTTTEPEEDVDYDTILTRSNTKQVTIQLPQEMLNLDKDKQQQALISIYPQEKDPETGSVPKMTFEALDMEEEIGPKLETVNGKHFLSWTIEPNEETPEALKQFITSEESQRIKNATGKLRVGVNVETLDTEISTISE